MQKLAKRVKEIEDELAICIKCGVCQSVCPLFQSTNKESDVARGKLALLDGIKKNLFTNPDGVNERLNRCLLCGSCAANCPSGVKVIEIFIKARAIIAEFKGLSPVKKLILRKIIANPDIFNKLTQWAIKFQSSFIFQNIFIRQDQNAQGTCCMKVMLPILGNRHFLPISDKPFSITKPNIYTPTTIPTPTTTISISTINTFDLKSTPIIKTSALKSGFKVAFFTGCIIDKIFPQLVQDVIDVFKFHRVDTYIPKNQGCCGITALALGDIKSFETLVEYHLHLFSEENFDYLVTACATCTFTIKTLWTSIYKSAGSKTKERIKVLSNKTFDINQFLVNKVSLLGKHESKETIRHDIISKNYITTNEVNAGGIGAKENGNDNENKNGNDNIIVTYHDPCHLKKSLGIFKEPRELIKASGNKLVEMEGSDQCCGMGGSFNLYHYDLSSTIGQIKINHIEQTKCTTVATGCPACMVQISDMLAKKGLNIKVCHPLELYAQRLRGLNSRFAGS